MTESVSVAAAVNDLGILAACLARSPDIVAGRCQLTTHEGHVSAAEALNAGLEASTASIVVLAHQDVYLPKGWVERLLGQISILNEEDPDWAVLGVIGLDLAGRLVGRVWSTGLNSELGSKSSKPTEVISIDECVIIIRRSAGLTFDERLPGWHLYAADIILQARDSGYKAFVVDDPVVHNSRPVRTLVGGYSTAYKYMQRKWRAALPVPTLVAPLTSGRLALLRAQWRRFKVRALRRQRVSSLDAVKVARDLGYE